MDLRDFINILNKQDSFVVQARESINVWCQTLTVSSHEAFLAFEMDAFTIDHYAVRVRDRKTHRRGTAEAVDDNTSIRIGGAFKAEFPNRLETKHEILKFPPRSEIQEYVLDFIPRDDSSDGRPHVRVTVLGKTVVQAKKGAMILTFA